MSAQEGNFFEEECLIQMLESITNEHKGPRLERFFDWRAFYKSADYHRVANIIYYGLLGMNPPVPARWREHFEYRYHKAVMNEQFYRDIAEAVLWQFERDGRHIMIVGSYCLQAYYPHPEMGLLDGIRFQVEKGSRRYAEEVARKMDFEPGDCQPGRYVFNRAGLKICFEEGFPGDTLGIRSHYGKPLPLYPLEEGRYYVHRMAAAEQYIRIVTEAAQAFARKEADLRTALELWLFYRKHRQGLNWLYVQRELGRMGLKEFCARLTQLDLYWFGRVPLPEAEEERDAAVAAFLFTKGAAGRKQMEGLLPLLKKTERRIRRRARHRKNKGKRHWLFPGYTYMRSMFPRLGRCRLFLPFCWLLRLIWIGWYRLNRYVGKSLGPLKDSAEEAGNP